MTAAFVFAMTLGLFFSSTVSRAEVIAQTDSTEKVYAVTNPNTGETLYTTDEKERKFLIKVGYTDDGIAFITSAEGSVPVYRVYNPNSGFHLYTVNAEERDFLLSIGYNSEGTAFYSSGNVTVYRCYDNNTGLHRYTLDQDARNVEGFAFKVVEADKDVINAYYSKSGNGKLTSVKITETGCSLYRAADGYMFSWGAKAVNASSFPMKDVVVKAEIYDDAGNVVDTREALAGNLMPGASAFVGSTLPINVKGKLITRAVISASSEKKANAKTAVESKVKVKDVSSEITYSEKYSYPAAEKVSFTYRNAAKDPATGFMNVVYRGEDGSLLGVAKTDITLSALEKGSKAVVEAAMPYPGPAEQKEADVCFVDTLGSKAIVRDTSAK